MLRDSIYQKLTEIFKDVFQDQSLVARPNLAVQDVERWDSFGHLTLIFAVEKEFSIDLSNSQVPSVGNAGDLAAVIEASLVQRESKDVSNGLVSVSKTETN